MSDDQNQPDPEPQAPEPEIPAVVDLKPDPTVPVPPMLGQNLDEGLGQGRICNFCHKVYYGKIETCPHCGKKFPKMASA